MPRLAPLYTRAGDRFEPGPLAQSPWSERHQNGIALAGLLTRTLEQASCPAQMTTARISIDIIRPVPFAPMAGGCRIVREGRNIQHVEARLFAGEQLYARAIAVRVRFAETPQVDRALAPDVSPEDAPLNALKLGRSIGLETRVIQGGPTQRGPGRAWARPNCEILPGEPASFVTGAAMVADIGSGLAVVLDARRWSFANVSICLHFVRPPRSEWIMIDAKMRTAGNGTGLVEGALADRMGVFARCYQSLFVTPLEQNGLGS